MKLSIGPFVLAAMVVGLWVGLRILGLNRLIEGDEGSMAGAAAPILGVFYAIFATFLIVTVWSQWNDVKDAVQSEDWKKYLLHKDKRIPGTLKRLFLMLSIFLVGALMLIYWRHLLTGGFTIFTISAAVSACWMAIMDLDDPFTGEWNVKIPDGWEERAKAKEARET